MANQIDNTLLSDDTTGLARTIDVGADAVFLSTDLTLQAGGVLTADNLKRGTADPNVALVPGNEGDFYQRTLATTGELYINTDGTTTGWTKTGTFVGGRLYDAVVDTAGGGDYTLISAAITAGAKSIFIRTGTYVETVDLTLTSGALLHGEEAGGVVIALSGAVSLRADGSGGVQENVGTVSITSGTSTVTGVGTTFTNLSAGDFITLGANFYEVLSIGGVGTLTLVDTYQGVTVSAEPYIAQAMDQGIVIENVVITGSTGSGLYLRAVLSSEVNTVASRGCAIGVEMVACGQSQLRNVSADNNTGNGIALDGCRTTHLHVAQAKNNGGNGVEINGGSQAVNLDNCHITANGNIGVNATASSLCLTISDSIISWNVGRGINTDVGSDSCVIEGSTITENGFVGIDFDGTDNLVSDCVVTNNGDAGIWSGDNGTVTGCTFSGNVSHGINADFDNNTTFTGNVITGNGGDGIFLDNTFDCIISANSIFSNTGDGVNILATSDNNTLSDNRIVTNGGAQVTDLSSTTIYGISAAGVAAQGDVLYFNGTVWTRLPPGTSGQVFQTQGAAANPIWSSSIGAASGGSHATLKQTTNVSTTSATYVDAMGGSSISPPFDGDYFVIFEGDINGSSGNTVNQIAIGLNGTTAAAAGTTGRTMQGNGGADIATSIHVVLTGLTTGDTVHGIFRKLAGSGTTTMGDRRITMIKVT